MERQGPRESPLDREAASTRNAASFPLKTSSVDLGDRQAIEIDIRQAANIDRRHRPGLALAVGIGRNSTVGTEMMLDDVFVELIGRYGSGGGLERQIFARHEGEKSAAPAAHRAIAIHRLRNIGLDLKGDGPAVTTSRIDHQTLPSLQLER